jgi:2-methylaconitate cis-trans-isomerase PrpF
MPLAEQHIYRAICGDTDEADDADDADTQMVPQQKQVWNMPGGKRVIRVTLEIRCRMPDLIVQAEPTSLGSRGKEGDST